MEYKIKRFRGIKNDETKKTTGGYLFIEFLKDVTTKRAGSIGIPTQRNAGEIVGFSVSGTTRKEAIDYFKSNFIIA